MKVEVKVGKVNTKALSSMKFLKDCAVYVGIPQESPSRKDDPGITNAELLFIHTNGSPINHIPKRPVIEPAIEHDKQRISKMLGDAAKSALDGNISQAIDQMSLVGIRGANVSRAWFVSPLNGWFPNSPSVQAAKRAKGSTIPRPLIDTGELRKSITYFVDYKGRRIK